MNQKQEYMEIPSWYLCTNIKNTSTSNSVCLPQNRPMNCPVDSWTRLNQLENPIGNCVHTSPASMTNEKGHDHDGHGYEHGRTIIYQQPMPQQTQGFAAEPFNGLVGLSGKFLKFELFVIIGKNIYFFNRNNSYLG